MENVVRIPLPGSLDRAALRRLLKQLRELEKNRAIRVVRIAGANAYSFSSGLDLRRLLHQNRLITALHVVDAEFLVYRIVRTIRRSSKIYMAELGGGVIGSAVSIALACDLRYGCADTWFWLPDPKYGGLLADGGLALLAASAGVTAAERLGLSMERLAGEDARRCGCLHELVAVDAVEDTVRYEASELAGRSALSLRYTKRLLKQTVRLHFPFAKLLRVVLSKEMIERLRRTCESSSKDARPPLQNKEPRNS